MITSILNEVHFELEKSVLLKDDFRLEIVFFRYSRKYDILWLV
ncbi:hypothetical protein [Streptococcus oralis]|nr:hypothetical protein [Streptococcus oralis]